MKLDVSRGEVLRYMGMKGVAPDAVLIQIVDEAVEALEAVVELKQLSRRFRLKHIAEGALDIGGLRIESRALAHNLAGCDEVFVMAATLGIGPDRLIARAQAAGVMSRAVALQAAAAVMIEAWCDRVNEGLRAQARDRGKALRPRFSPGYGDFPLECQPGLFRLLGVQRNIGITLTDSLLMIPTKSVTAVIGIGDAPGDVSAGCAACKKTDCAFRVTGGNER